MPLEKKSIWFLGTSPFAVPSLEALLADPSFSVDLVITQPDRPAGRKQELTPPPVKAIAQKHGVKIVQPENVNHFPLSTFHSPEYLVVVSFGQILSQQILDIPTIAPVNLHASLLPRWRGASPIHHAILAGDATTGVTVQKMVKELDAGPVLAQETVMINPRETVTSLHDKLALMGAALLIQTLKKPLHPVDQDSSKVTVCHKFKREDGIVDPATMTAEEIDRKVRGLHPWPGVLLKEAEGPERSRGVKILETSLNHAKDSSELPCTKGTVLHLVMVQPAGGKAMTGKAWMRGHH